MTRTLTTSHPARATKIHAPFKAIDAAAHRPVRATISAAALPGTQHHSV